MPYCKSNDPYGKTKMLLKAYDVTPTRLARIIGKTYPTAKKKIDNPAHITSGEWMKISRQAHIPVEEVREVFLS